MSEEAVRAAFTFQAQYCEASGSHLTARMLRAVERVLDRSTGTGVRILDWAGDARGSRDSVPLRLAGGLHALARRGADARLTGIYAGTLIDDEEVDAVLRDVLARHDDELKSWCESPPQTNETGRAAAIMAGLLVLASQIDLPFELLELGASAGLNLNLDRFGYRLGTVSAGDPASRVQLAPIWEGPSPPRAQVRIIARRGVDQSPIDLSSLEARARLAAYVWPDQPDRIERLEAALAIAAQHPPWVERADAADFVDRVLREPAKGEVLRVFYHTIFWTYLPADKQDRIASALAGAGKEAPLAWLRYELNGQGGVAELLLTTWPGGQTRCLAIGHPHAAALRWTD